MSLAVTAKRMHSRNGAAYTIRREALAAGSNAWTAGAATVTYHACTARERLTAFDGAGGLRGGFAQDEVRVSVDAATAATVPIVNDRIAKGTFNAGTDSQAEWMQVTAVASPAVKGVVHRYVLVCRR